MTPIPRAALGLGLAGLIPFVWGAASQLFPGLAEMGLAAAGPRFVGPYVSLAYGTVILSFMSGVLWGFATRATGSAAATGYALSVLPALWAFLTGTDSFLTAAVLVAAAECLCSGLAQPGWQV